jgi:hypothetical protein
MSIGPNTNAPREVVSADCILCAGEDPAETEPHLAKLFGPARQAHAFRSYVFQKRDQLTTIFSGMGTACVEPLIWELRDRGINRILLAGTAGQLRPGTEFGKAYAITAAGSAGTGIDGIGLTICFWPRWRHGLDIPIATAISTDFYYGFSKTVLQPEHPLHKTRLPQLFQAAEADLVDMEVAPFYALCERLLPPNASYLAIKSPANPAGLGQGHLANTPRAMQACLESCRRLLAV